MGTIAICCSKVTPRPWHAALSAPAHYPISSPFVRYFKNGSEIAGTQALFKIYQDWNVPTEISGPIKVYPDSVFVAYQGLNSKGHVYEYEGGFKISANNIENLFKSGFIRNGEKDDFNLIITGLAPGGNVCVWVDHVEICRFKAKEIKFVSKNPEFYAEGEELNLNTTEYNNYIKHHPVVYENWEKPDKGYDLDFGFCSQDGKSVYVQHICYTKEGQIYNPGNYYTETTQWEVPYGKSDKDMIDTYIQYGETFENKMFLPVHIVYEWKNPEGKVVSTDVVMPKDFPQRFEKAYINPQTGKEAHYNRVTLGVEKDGKHAIIWLDGPGKQEKLMRFKGHLKKVPYYSGGYAEDVTYY
jgi:Protein of unknown function (DUF2931)